MNLAAASRAAGRESPRRERAAAAAREVLRPRLGALGARRHVSTRSPPACSERTDFFFDNSPVFKLGPGAAPRDSARSRPSTAPRRCAAGGRGVRNTSTAASSRSRPGSATAGCCSSVPRSCSARSRTAPSSCCSTVSSRAWHGRRLACLGGDGGNGLNTKKRRRTKTHGENKLLSGVELVAPRFARGWKA